MSGINSVSGVGFPKPPVGVSESAGARKAPGKTDFGQVLSNYVTRVDNDQQVSAEAIQKLLAGNSQDVLPVVAAVAKADLSFKLLMGIRNKVIEAYKQTMNMQL